MPAALQTSFKKQLFTKKYFAKIKKPSFENGGFCFY